MIGKIHSIESMGLVDGPGLRSVVFMQGCNLRCQYCHNPDTWSCLEKAEEYTSEALVKKLCRFKSYYDKGNGGVTFSGGEPLLQPDFLIECLKGLRENGIHTCIDTAGVGVGRYEEILEYVDLILFDIKEVSKEGYKNVTGLENDESLKFLDVAQKMNKKFWIRHVVVPGLTDGEEHIKEVAKFVKTIKNVEKVELLPYHVLGVNKYETMGIKYKLAGVEPMDKEIVKGYYKFFE